MMMMELLTFLLLIMIMPDIIRAHKNTDIRRFIRHSYPAETPVNKASTFLRRRLELEEDLPGTAGGLGNKTVAGLETEGPSREIVKILVGNWVAQWDDMYQTWFYYNINTDVSTWNKPRELQHVRLNSPSDLSSKTKSSNTKLFQSNSQTQYQAIPPQAQSKILESSQDNFFGFNTKPVKTRGLVGGLYDSLSYLYESVIQDYVESVYTDVIEGYTIATIKLIGWFVFGSLLVVKGALINHYASSAKDFGRALAGDHFQPETSTATFYILKNLHLTFPVSESVLSCYQDRPSCVDNDFNQEVQYLFNNIHNFKHFIIDWLEFSEKIGTMATEGEMEL